MGVAPRGAGKWRRATSNWLRGPEDCVAVIFGAQPRTRSPAALSVMGGVRPEGVRSMEASVCATPSSPSAPLAAACLPPCRVAWFVSCRCGVSLEWAFRGSWLRRSPSWRPEPGLALECRWEKWIVDCRAEVCPTISSGLCQQLDHRRCGELRRRKHAAALPNRDPHPGLSGHMRAFGAPDFKGGPSPAVQANAQGADGCWRATGTWTGMFCSAEPAPSNRQEIVEIRAMRQNLGDCPVSQTSGRPQKPPLHTPLSCVRPRPHPTLTSFRFVQGTAAESFHQAPFWDGPEGCHAHAILGHPAAHASSFWHRSCCCLPESGPTRPALPRFGRF